MNAKKVLLIGLDPQGYDYANSPFPNLTPQIVMAGLESDLATLNKEGYDARMVLVDPIADAASAISRVLQERFDCILLGGARCGRRRSTFCSSSRSSTACTKPRRARGCASTPARPIPWLRCGVGFRGSPCK